MQLGMSTSSFGKETKFSGPQTAERRQSRVKRRVGDAGGLLIAFSSQALDLAESERRRFQMVLGPSCAAAKLDLPTKQNSETRSERAFSISTSQDPL